MTTIYLITNKINGKKYVGKTLYSLKKRFDEHCIGYKDNHMYIDSAIHKYGKENFTIDVLTTCDDSEWKYWENFYINQCNSHWSEGGYNLSWGGDHNPMEDEEVKRRHAVACASPEHREKLMKASTGKKHTLESRAKMSKIQKEVYKNPELRRKVKLNQPKRIPVDMLDADDNLVMHFDTLMDACRYFGKSCAYSSSIKNMIDKYNKNGKRSRFLGYYWRSCK